MLIKTNSAIAEDAFWNLRWKLQSVETKIT